MLAIKKPPKGQPEQPEPVTIPLKVLVPTLAGAAGAGVGAVLLRVLSGIALEAL